MTKIFECTAKYLDRSERKCWSDDSERAMERLRQYAKGRNTLIVDYTIEELTKKGIQA